MEYTEANVGPQWAEALYNPRSERGGWTNQVLYDGVALHNTTRRTFLAGVGSSAERLAAAGKGSATQRTVTIQEVDLGRVDTARHTFTVRVDYQGQIPWTNTSRGVASNPLVEVAFCTQQVRFADVDEDDACQLSLSAKLIERCSDGVEGQGAEEASWGQERMVSSVLAAGSRASDSPLSSLQHSAPPCPSLSESDWNLYEGGWDVDLRVASVRTNVC